MKSLINLKKYDYFKKDKSSLDLIYLNFIFYFFISYLIAFFVLFCSNGITLIIFLFASISFIFYIIMLNLYLDLRKKLD